MATEDRCPWQSSTNASVRYDRPYGTNYYSSWQQIFEIRINLTRPHCSILSREARESASITQRFKFVHSRPENVQLERATAEHRLRKDKEGRWQREPLLRSRPSPQLLLDPDHSEASRSPQSRLMAGDLCTLWDTNRPLENPQGG